MLSKFAVLIAGAAAAASNTVSDNEFFTNTAGPAFTDPEVLFKPHGETFTLRAGVTMHDKHLVFPSEDVTCANNDVAPDGLPIKIPRSVELILDESITAVTGVHTVSFDWYPCGHPANPFLVPHIDQHLWTITQEERSTIPNVGPPESFRTPGCAIGATVVNDKQTVPAIKTDMPGLKNVYSIKGVAPEDEFVCSPFCVPATGVHCNSASANLDGFPYGKTPVQITVGSDEKIAAYEPSTSWEWITTHGPAMPEGWSKAFDVPLEHRTLGALPYNWTWFSTPVGETEAFRFEVVYEGRNCVVCNEAGQGQPRKLLFGGAMVDRKCCTE